MRKERIESTRKDPVETADGKVREAITKQN